MSEKKRSDILEVLSLGQATATEISRELGVSKHPVTRRLLAMVEEGSIVRQEIGRGRRNKSVVYRLREQPSPALGPSSKKGVTASIYDLTCWAD